MPTGWKCRYAENIHAIKIATGYKVQFEYSNGLQSQRPENDNGFQSQRAENSVICNATTYVRELQFQYNQKYIITYI